MRIGIVTFHCAYNYGSALQAFALKTILEKMGHSVNVIDYRGADFEKYRIIRISSLRSIAESIVFLNKKIKCKKSFESFMKKNLCLTERFAEKQEADLSRLNSRFDCFICGSDQIWNLDCTSGPVSPFFLSFVIPGKKRIAYAPSLSHISFQPENFTNSDRDFIRKQLNQFNAISIREAATRSLFQALVDQPIETCIDPTLLLNSSEYKKLKRVPNEAVGRRFLFVYMLEKNPLMIEYAESIANRLGLDILYSSKRNLGFSKDAINLYGMGPGEFLGCIDNAAAVITNSFHATVFSILFEKPFQVFLTSKSGSRIKELLENLGEEQHLVDGTKIEVPEAVDEASLSERLEALRDSSNKFLRGALEG